MIKPIHSRDLFRVLKENIDIPDDVISMTLVLSVDAPVVVSYTKHATPPVGKREELTNADLATATPTATPTEQYKTAIGGGRK